MRPILYKQGSSYTIVEFKLHSRIRYCIWYLDENDDERFQKMNAAIAVFLSEDDAHKAFADKNIAWDKVSFDIDNINTSISTSVLDTTSILDFINIMTDIMTESDMKIHEEPEFGFIYNKLFCGENLSVINLSDKEYIPVFEIEEIAILQKYVDQCLRILEASIFC